MNKKKPLEKSILLLAKSGDLDAFEQILFFYEKDIFNYCLWIVKSKDDVEDIIQDTFIKVYSHCRNIDPDKNLKTWIFTIATNTAYDFLRSKKRKNEVSLEGHTETIEEVGAYYLKDGVVSDVENALNFVNEDYKKALVLFYQEGFKYEEIADILGIPINTVKTHIKRGKDQLRDILKNYST